MAGTSGAQQPPRHVAPLRATSVRKVLLLGGKPRGCLGAQARRQPRSIVRAALAAPHGRPVSTAAAGGQMRRGRKQRAAAAAAAAATGCSGGEVATVVRLRGEGGAWDCVAADPQRRRSSSAASDTGLLTPCGHRDPTPATWRFSVPLSPGRLPLALSRTSPENIFGGAQEAFGAGKGEPRGGIEPGLFRRLALRMKEVCLK